MLNQSCSEIQPLHVTSDVDRLDLEVGESIVTLDVTDLVTSESPASRYPRVTKATLGIYEYSELLDIAKSEFTWWKKFSALDDVCRCSSRVGIVSGSSGVRRDAYRLHRVWRVGALLTSHVTSVSGKITVSLKIFGEGEISVEGSPVPFTAPPKSPPGSRNETLTRSGDTTQHTVSHAPPSRWV